MNIETNSPKTEKIYLKDYTAPDYLINSIDLIFELNETKTLVTSEIVFAARMPKQKSLFLNGVNLTLLSIEIDGKTLSPHQFEKSPLGLTLFNPPDFFTLKTQVEINPETNKSCEGLYLSQGIFCTQCEAESFRKITYSIDRPDVMAVFTTTIIADTKKYPVLLSNGDLVQTKILPDGRESRLWKDPYKKPSYLFALVAGDLGCIQDYFITRSGRKIKLSVYASHGKQDRCYHCMESLKKALKWDEEKFGLEYDLNEYMIVSIDDFNMGAMENKGLNVFNSRLVLADRKSATDQDYETIEAVVGHEYFHNWTGNRVTCRNWFELSLKEGLTVFRDQEFSADLNSRAVQRIKDVDQLKFRQFPEDAGANSHPVRPVSCLAVDNFYTATIYEKGAEVIRMMQTLVGREGFRNGMDEYFKRHDGQAVTIDDFAAAISETNNRDFKQFKLWYSQAGTPQVEVQENYDAAQKCYSVVLKQSLNQRHFEPFHIPLNYGLIDNYGLEIKSGLIELKSIQETFTFENMIQKPVLSLNREFSAPIQLKWTVPQDELYHLMKFDSDPYNRREASLKLMTEECLRLTLNPSAVVNPDILTALDLILGDQKIDHKFKSLILQIPSESTLALAQSIFDPEAIHNARVRFGQALIQKFESRYVEKYHEYSTLDTIGARSLKNLILSILSLGGSSISPNLIIEQYQKAANMTDRLHALMLACNSNAPARDMLLSDFKNIWIDDKVVMNKWFQVQAFSTSSDTFIRVKNCLMDKAYDRMNPNNIYSLLGSFGTNLKSFFSQVFDVHPWYLEQIKEIDLNNPQAAARLANSFQLVGKLSAPVKDVSRKIIHEAIVKNNYSKNVLEILEKL